MAVPSCATGQAVRKQSAKRSRTCVRRLDAKFVDLVAEGFHLTTTGVAECVTSAQAAMQSTFEAFYTNVFGAANDHKPAEEEEVARIEADFLGDASDHELVANEEESNGDLAAMIAANFLGDVNGCELVGDEEEFHV
eukprot:TRINITY_DN57524_c0_g1_i1.p2 TRINITY_DN57524_c0_g1~~TRINITY_DN57524_c0_g1_i1.p2  ORF type:complete len:137 (+),score=37.51 TRINITY_DN57524_c0_g1_i1:78-488(+)